MAITNERPITNEKAIRLYLHCAKCGAERLAELSIKEFADLEVGWTEQGIQVWCKRHNCNVIHIDFEGSKHPANDTTATETTKES